MIEKGRTDQIIEQLIDSVENGQNVPFAPGKVSVNKEETIRLLRELENIVQGELKIYREVNDRKGKILTEAKKEAEEILTQAEQNASRIRVNEPADLYDYGRLRQWKDCNADRYIEAFS